MSTIRSQIYGTKRSKTFNTGGQVEVSNTSSMTEFEIRFSIWTHTLELVELCYLI